MSDAGIDGTVLDHVAHAVHHWQDVWHRYATDLGAEWNSGGPGPGFAPGQLRFANQSRVEVLMPYDTGVNDFLERFLAASGPGPHHLTFKVPDLEGALDQVRSSGFDPIGVDLRNPEWMEAFVHPKQAGGIVVQLAEAPAPWLSDPPDDYPTARRLRGDGSAPVPPASLVRVVHAVADHDASIDLFAGLLGASAVAEGAAPDHRWTDLAWPGPLSLRLISASGSPAGPMAAWLGDRPGRLHHLEFEASEPAGLPGWSPAADDLVGLGDTRPEGTWTIAPEDNAGLRLVATPR